MHPDDFWSFMALAATAVLLLLASGIRLLAG